jgi:lipid A 3-O-deacylase
MLPSFRLWQFGLSVIVLRIALHGAEASQPWAASNLTVESGVLWQVGHNTPLPYRLVPTQLSWRSGEFIGHGFADGSRLVVRHRLTLLGTWIQQGPEAHYVGVAGSPSVEWWNKAGTWSAFGGAGGGVGAIDSRGVRGGQGQDFTLNWFARAGIEHALSSNARISAGIMFQHLSNGGRTKPNPGIDAVGFTVGWSWRY